MKMALSIPFKSLTLEQSGKLDASDKPKNEAS